MLVTSVEQISQDGVEVLLSWEIIIILVMLRHLSTFHIWQRRRLNVGLSLLALRKQLEHQLVLLCLVGGLSLLGGRLEGPSFRYADWRRIAAHPGCLLSHEADSFGEGNLRHLTRSVIATGAFGLKVGAVGSIDILSGA